MPPTPRVTRHPVWLRFLLTVLAIGGCAILLLIGTILGLGILWQNPWFQGWVFQQSMGAQGRSIREPDATPAAPYTGPKTSTTGLASAKEFYQTQTIWEGHFSFTAQEWEALGPVRIKPLHNWLKADGTPRLRNPYASRAGIAGVLGWDLPWSSGTFELGGLTFQQVAVRYKGNGTFLSGLGSYRRPFKVDLNEHVRGQKIAGRSTLNFHNLEADHSFLKDTLAYEFFRDAGVPAPATAFIRLFLSIENRWEHRLLGPYLMVENPDRAWAESVFGRDDVALFKPVIEELFQDVGNDWVKYAQDYDPKTPPSEAQKQRLIDLCRLVTSADDASFNAALGDLMDLEETARFFACLSLLSCYDSILDNNQNFLMWIDPRTQRIGFSPWDLDHSWGEFPFVGTMESRERASIFHPWVGQKRFLERLFAHTPFRDLYRREMARLLETLFIPKRLHRRIDELASVIRPAIAEFSGSRLAEFESLIADPPGETGAQEKGRHAGYSLKRFISVRAKEVKLQLDGHSEGVILNRNR